MATSFDVKLANVAAMKAESGYDVTIVCCSDAPQAAFWQAHLEQGKGSVIPASSLVIAVDEDWEGGAGNFLGTLYAWKKASAKAKESTGRDITTELANGASVALFHTAGKGTRLAPLPGAENNNKPGVKLPAPGCPSILESVIRQTGAYAASRKGRLSVFWGDQVFVPSVAVEYSADFHVDILCALGPMPSAEEWKARMLHKYGLIAARETGEVGMMLEKVTHEQASEQLANISGVDRVGTSLGSFSLSAAFLEALVAGFSEELEAKKGKMDSDPHVWMAMTLNEAEYARLMIDKSLFEESGAKAHHKRVLEIVDKVKSAESKMKGMFGSVNVGSDFSWWDYGQLALYSKNGLLLTEDSEDARLARGFFGIEETNRTASANSLGTCEVDGASVASSCRVSSGKVTGSALANVCTKELQADGAVLVNVCATKIKAAKGAVAYNIVDNSEDGLSLGENEVRVGVFTCSKENPYFEMSSNVADIDGGKVFKEKVCGNKYSFQEVYDLNHGVDVTQCGEAAKASFATRSAAL
mmetsp:Transcript_69332/g.144774  ORF Transcript_69332/g.144774 Transcript_69332/m.144774 type:complete len:528 (-) Transcript_69332:232-1815(-)